MATTTHSKGIVERIIDARMAYLFSRRKFKSVICKLPTKDYDEWKEWVYTIDNDPYLGYRVSGLQEHAFGMDIVHAPLTFKIEVTGAC